MPNRPKINPERMTTGEAAEYLGLTSSTLSHWRSIHRENGPPYLKLGGKVFYSQSALDRWLERSTVGAK